MYDLEEKEKEIPEIRKKQILNLLNNYNFLIHKK